MRTRFLQHGFALALLLACIAPVKAQGVINDLLAGKLLDPKVGQWAWYTLEAADGGQRFAVRQAIVGSEPVGRRTGYWLEVEVVPAAGYKSVFKMLLTGPASDPRNVHRILAKQGLDPVQEVPVEAQAAETPPAARRRSMGMETVETPSGLIRAERFAVTQGEQTMDIWLLDDVLPTGIVRMRSDEGDMVLRSYGVGGRDADSLVDAALTEESAAPAAPPTPVPQEEPKK